MTNRTGKPAPALRRMNLVFEGHVQGVGFRYATAELARDLPVGGFVRNRPDGSVEVVAEGVEADLFRLWDAVKSSGVGRFIRSERVNWSTATGEFDTFSVRYG